MRLTVFGLPILLLAASLAAATATDITGQWTARTIMAPSGSETPVPTIFTFKMEGNKVTGSVSSPRGNYEVLDGKVDGDSVTFNALVTVGNNPIKLLYDGKITSEGIDFLSSFEGGDRTDHFIAKRLPE